MGKLERSGIAVAGSVLVDKINEIRSYPKCGELTQITKVESAVGGCVPNVSVDLKKICPDLKVSAIRRIGNDQEGRFITDILSNEGVDTSGLAIYEDEKTSFTEVMSVVNGQRTFFAYPGASAEFGYDDIPFDKLNERILHLGYFLLLQKVDEGDGVLILKKAKEIGMKTAIDIVSENSDRYFLIRECLPYVDYLIINEYEAGKLAGMEASEENLEKIAYILKEMGVNEKVIIHMPSRAICLSNDEWTEVGSYILPDDFIKGTTGAGDAFCAGCLIGIHEGFSDKEMLEFASGCAVMALCEADATSGLVKREDIHEYCSQFERYNVDKMEV